MKQCPQCERIYPDNTLSYCLDDGAALLPPFNLEATQINTSIPPSVVPPTVAYNEPPVPSPAQTPTPRRGLRPLVLGLVVLVVLLIGLLIGVWLSQRPNESSANLQPATPTPVRPAPIKPTPTPTPILVTEPATPTPSPLATPSPKNVELEPECMLYNDKADRSGVITRSDCDKKDCESDMSTMGDEYPDRTRVQVIKGSNVQGKRFRWVKVFLIEEKLTVWVAASKIKC